MTRVVTYLTGSRADFGLMERALRAIHVAPDLTLDILATGQQLSEKHGLTVCDAEATGMPVRRLEAVPMEGTDGLEMGQSVALQMHAITAALAANRPDLLIVLGDRGEMVAGALAAVFLGIPIAHFHGGERSGTVDDQLRRAISAVAQFHFPATPGARERLLAMGELDDHVFQLGAPGLDAIRDFVPEPPQSLRAAMRLAPEGRLITCVYHPVVQDADLAACQVRALLDALAAQDADVVVMAPNSDAGSAEIAAVYQNARQQAPRLDRPARLHFLTHLKRDRYLSLLAASDLLVGNSSSGIIEAASLSTAVVNVGDRQAHRERGPSVFDCLPEVNAIVKAIDAALAYDGPFHNVYDGGGVAERLPRILSQLDLSRNIIKKRYTY